MVCMYIVPRNFNYIYTFQNDVFKYAMLNITRQLDNWWDWYRTGRYHQVSRKKWVIKKTTKQVMAYWRRCLPAKSGWVGKAMARRKGA